jgi:glycosyltransferase involved in cell wall biosynthesis
MNRIVQMHYGVMHPMFREQLHAVPAGYTYRSSHPALAEAQRGPKRIAQEAGRFPRAQRLGERLALRALSRAGYVHQTRARALDGAELIHSTERLLVASPLPYVMDFEHASLFVLYQAVALRQPWTRAWLARVLADERLRALLPWTEMARRSLLVALGPRAESLKSKMVTVYPAIRPAVERPAAQNTAQLRLLFIGTAFFEKGAVEAILATQRLAATHDVHLDLLSYVPPSWQARLSGQRTVTLHTPGPDVDVRELYRRSDALLFPSHMDTLGYVVLEAMAHGIPVLAPRHLAFPEMVEQGVSGLLFGAENQLYGEDTICRFPHTLPPPARFLRALESPGDAYVDGIAETVARLAEDGGLRERLAAGALERVRHGRFSIARRREALGEVYSAALG